MIPYRPWQRPVGVVLLLVGLATAALRLAPEWPVRQQLVLKVEAPGSVRELHATWTREGEDSPRGGTRSSFPSGAPTTIERSVSLPNGDYALSVTVTRRVGRERVETMRTHRLRLEGRPVTVFVDAANQP